MFKERIQGLFPFIRDKKTEESQDQEEWPVTGEVPGHDLVTTSPQNSSVQARLAKGELEKVGEVSVYISSPRRYWVVRPTAVVATGVVAASAVAGFGVYKLIEYLRKRRGKTTQDNPGVSSSEKGA